MNLRIPHLLFCLSAMASSAEASLFVYEPSPYLGSFDSPFFDGIQAGTIFLEDFEDGELNTPFVIANDINHEPLNRWVSQTVLTGNPNSRPFSVDEDDGLNGDFLGFGGDSLQNISMGGGSRIFEFVFSPDTSGNYPRHVGLVVTQPEDFLDEDVDLDFEDLIGDTEDATFDPAEWDPAFVGDTRSHRFIGAFSDAGIVRFRVEGAFEIDHLQYGYAIPEPSTPLLVLATLSALLFRRQRRR